ncbi:hypothetical protein [Streptomyces sp. NPDC001714]|uniref:hypothetical protein n=1 Tax=Streptomyces sp. NPDC001714 TaxID=3364603 RepID=UPI0036890819
MAMCLRQPECVLSLLCLPADELGCFDESGLDAETLMTTSPKPVSGKIRRGELRDRLRGTAGS